jgi:hypothetical protein
MDTTDTNMVTIALVLKTGGEYDYKYVNNIVKGIKKNTTVPHRIVCLTDNSDGFSSDIDATIQFEHNWPKWWGKIELFRPGLFSGQVLFMDLDTFIVGNIDSILNYSGEFCAIRDFYNLDHMASGLMSWHGDRVNKIYDEFVKNPTHLMAVNNVSGDGAIIRKYKPSIAYFQDIYPNDVVSYKVHCVNQKEVVLPSTAKIVCFHGNPRPHTINNNFSKYWEQ